MLTDNQIEKLIQPIVDNQEALNIWVLKRFMKLITSIEKLETDNVLEIQKLIDVDREVRKLYTKINNDSISQLDEISTLLMTVAIDSYVDSEYLYDYRHLKYPAFKKNKQMQKRFKDVLADCIELCAIALLADTMLLVNNQKAEAMSLKNAYQTVLNRCVIAKKNKSMKYSEQLKSLVNQLCESGVRTRSNTTTQRASSALHRDLVESVKNVQQTVQDVVAEQVKADGVELSAHIDSAPDHMPVQGRQFTLAEFDKLQSAQVSTSVTGKSFEPIVRAIGEWNCRHYTYAIIVGVSKPKYTESALEQLQRENENWFTLDNGKPLTMYECTQRQRYLERMIRLNKTNQMMFKQLGDMKTATSYQVKINNLISEYADFSDACHISAKWERTEIAGYYPLKVNEYVYY